MNVSDDVANFAHRIRAMGFRVWIAERGTYGFISDASETRVLSFSFTDGSSLSGNYGPPSTTSGTGWRMDEVPYDLKTADDVRRALNAYPPSFTSSPRKGWSKLTTVAEYLKQYNASSRFAEVA